MRHRTLACAFIGALLLASGCGERAEPVGELSQTYPVSVRGAGESPTVLERPPRRIVALDPGSAELVAALGAGRRLVGVPALAGRGRAVEVVTVAGTVDVDAVVDLRPDVVVGTTSTDPLDLARAARESGAASYLQPSASVADVQRGVVELGFLLGRAPKARQLVGDMRHAIARVEARVAGEPIEPVFVDTGFLITVAERSLAGDLVQRARGRSVAGPTPGPEPFEPCRVVRLGAEVVLVVAEPRQRTPASEFAACRGGNDIRIATVPPRLVLRAGPRIAKGLDAVARALHPDAAG